MAIENDLPRLKSSRYQISSPATSDYNCIAFAFGDTDRWWWPDKMDISYWPSEVPREETLVAFVKAFEFEGYRSCRHGRVEHRFEKVAIYVKDDVPTHAARQSKNGPWVSKLGTDIDITHGLEALEGGTYGTVACFMKRRWADAPPFLDRKSILFAIIVLVSAVLFAMLYLL